MEANDEQRLLCDWAEYNVPADLLSIPSGVSPLARRVALARAVTVPGTERPTSAAVLAWPHAGSPALP